MVAGSAMWIAPVGTGLDEPGWQHVGHTTGDVFYTVEDEPVIDMDALRRGLAGGQTISTTFTLARRQANRLHALYRGRTWRHHRNRRRNPLHAVRDQLRRHHRERFHGRR
jgi:hypothetical protein